MAEEASATRKLSPSVNLGIRLLATATVGLYMYTAIAGQLPAMFQRSILLGVSMIVVFLLYPASKQAPRWFLSIDIVFILVTVGALVMIGWTERQWVAKGRFEMLLWQLPVALAFVLLVLEASRRVMGVIMPILVLFSLIYGFTSGSWPGVFHTFAFSPMMIMEFVALSREGIFGSIAHIVSTMIIMFMIFAAFLKFSGGGKFFFDFPLAVFGRVRGGPAKVAVVGSALFGMFSGSATANVVATGTFTIPMMKATGYRAADAGAIEACASTGGQLMPPVMGAAAFVIAENLGVRYWDVCVAAFVPGLLFYVALFSVVDIKAAKLGLKGLPASELPSAWRTLKASGYLAIPLAVLIYFLAVVQASAMFSCFWAIVAVFALSWVRRENWMTPKRILNACDDAIKDSLGVVLVCGIAGIIVGILGLTGLGFKLTVGLVDVSRGNVFVLLAMAAVVCYILGMAITTTGIYILVATTVAPALIKMGLPPMSAHLGVFYFAMLSFITPPVATAVYAAAALAKEDFWKIGWQSCRLGLILFLLPFVFIFEPALILKGSVVTILVTLVSTFVGVALFSFILEGSSYWGRMSIVSRVILGIACILLLIPSLSTDLMGYAALAVGGVVHWRQIRTGVLAPTSE